jgi:hypothetical protein
MFQTSKRFFHASMDEWKKKHKTASTSLPEDEHVDVQNMSKTL